MCITAYLSLYTQVSGLISSPKYTYKSQGLQKDL